MISGSVKCRAELLERRVGDREVVGGEQVGVGDRRALGVRQVRRLLGLLERADELLGQPVGDAVAVAHGHAAAALVVERDADAHELDEPVWKRGAFAQRLLPGNIGTAREGAFA